jgi:hypothetical protein
MAEYPVPNTTPFHQRCPCSHATAAATSGKPWPGAPAQPLRRGEAPSESGERPEARASAPEVQQQQRLAGLQFEERVLRPEKPEEPLEGGGIGERLELDSEPGRPCDAGSEGH